MDSVYHKNYVSLGLNIAFYRKKKGLTQAQLAEKLNISLSHVGGIEQGKHSAALDLIWKICDILEIPPEDLFTFR